jgi:queuine tRNA-ribosyltransferase
MNWMDPFLTDSGGYQIFFVATLRKSPEEGVEFQHHIDGAASIPFSPEIAMEIQTLLGSDNRDGAR